MKVIGWDIGGANTKVAFLATRNGYVRELRTASKYFPIWKNPDQLYTVLTDLRNQISGSEALDCVGVTMTAELSDTYGTKREGVNHVLAQVVQAFPASRVLVLDVEAELRSLDEAKANPLRVAAGNWAATGWMVSKLLGYNHLEATPFSFFDHSHTGIPRIAHGFYNNEMLSASEGLHGVGMMI